MIALRFLDEEQERQPATYAYRIGAAIVAARRSIPLLEPYAVSDPNDELAELTDSPAQPLSHDGQTLIHQGQGWLSNAWRPVASWRTPYGYRLDVDGIGSFAIRADGAQICELAADEGVSAHERDEVVLGPGLIVAMALQGQWALHASAVLWSDGAIAFLGESGAGKSTLARYLHDQAGGRCVRIADDILLAEPRDGGVDALPRYLQLKLPVEQWPSAKLPTRIPLRVAYVVDSQRPDSRTVSITHLNGRQASLSLLRHTVAARLFGNELLEKHVNFCAKAVETLPVRLITYPLDFGVLPQVRDAIMDDAGDLVLP